MSHEDDPYRRLNYRRLIAWPARLERERAFLESELAKAPDKSVLDLGCGTGEHAQLFASMGYTAVGIDRSAEMVEKARDYENQHSPYGPTYVEGDFAELAERIDSRFGAAICLGNVLPHLEDRELERCLDSWAERLLPGGRLVVQLINYERVRGRGIRALPVNFREHPEGGEVVFVRLMTPDGDRHILFHPTTLHLRPGAERPVELTATKEVRLRAWTRAEIEAPFEGAGFECAATFGDMTGGAYEPLDSSDLVVVAVRRAG